MDSRMKNTPYNSIYKKFAVHWLNEFSCFEIANFLNPQTVMRKCSKMIKYIFLLFSLTSLLSKTQAQDILHYNSCISIPDTLDNIEIISHPDSIAKYPGGDLELMNFFSKNLKFNHEEYQMTFHVTFIVDSKGKIRNPCIYKQENSKEPTSSERKLIDLINKMPEWEPGIKNGSKVYTRRFLPIILELR